MEKPQAPLKLFTEADVVFWFSMFGRVLPVTQDAEQAALLTDAALLEYKKRTSHLNIPDNLTGAALGAGMQ